MVKETSTPDSVFVQVLEVVVSSTGFVAMSFSTFRSTL